MLISEGCPQKGECEKLREEVNRLKGELEHRALKGDFNCNARVLHFKMNPATIAQKQAEEKHLALLQEVEELRARLVSGNSSSGPVGSSLHAQGKRSLKKKKDNNKNELKLSSKFD